MEVFKLFVAPLHELIGYGHVAQEYLLDRLFQGGHFLGCFGTVPVRVGVAVIIARKIRELAFIPTNTKEKGI